MREHTSDEIAAEAFAHAYEQPKANGRDHQFATAIRLIPFEQITLGQNARPYCVKGLIPREGLTIIWGPPKSGKSFWTFDLCMHVALGWDYRGRKVQQGSVVYCSFEGQAGLAARIEAFRQEKLAEEMDSSVPYYGQTMTLDLVKQAPELIRAIRANGITPTVVTLDTLNRSLRGSENSDEDMEDYIKAVDAIREAFGCAVIIVHHCGVEGTRPRGHTSLTGAADAQLACKRDRNNIEVRVEWMKDGDSEGQVVASSLKSVEVGTDADGEPITSCVVVAAEPAASEMRAKKKLPANQETMLHLLQDAGKEGLTLSEWNSKAKEQGIGTPSAIQPCTKPKGHSRKRS
jgi:hypothetical protein